MLRLLLHTLSIWIVIVPFLIGIMNFKGLNSDSRWIFSLVCIALIPQLMTAFVRNDTAPFNIAYNLYTPIEFLMLYAIFITKFASSSSKRTLNGSFVIYVSICAYVFSSFGISDKFIGSLVCVNNIIYMFWILMLLKQEYGSDLFLIQKDNPFTWFFTAFILYAPCTVATFALYYYIRNPNSAILRNLAVIQDVFNILQYFFLSIGLLIRKN